MDPFFDAVRPAPVTTSAGPCDLPILYKDASLLGLFYRVDPSLAAGLVPAEDGVEPWVVLGKVFVLVCMFEYRETTIGPYGELGLAVMVKRRGRSPSLLRALVDMRKEDDAALYVVNLPVTTEGARAAGKELWGYPKYKTGMQTEFRPDGIRFVLEGELEYTMGRGPGLTTAGMPFVTFSVNARGRLLRTIVDVDHRVRWGGASTVKLAILGDGPTTKTVKTLGLDAMKPVLAFRTDGMRSILPLGTDLGAVRDAKVAEDEVRANGALQ
jgi:hypothetical protein